jgi:shikimate dehydrogenase
VNGTPLGMIGYAGSPVPGAAFPRAAWAFDAVYTPVETPFRAQAITAGAAFLSGWELFFWQGLHAFRLFTGHAPNAADLRTALGDAPPLPAMVAR